VTYCLSAFQLLSGLAGRRIGMVFQNPGGSLNPVVTVGTQIGDVVGRHLGLTGRARRAEVLELLARVGIPDATRAEAYPHELSGGLKQRVAIAAALAGRRSILLADEPTTALDATVQAQILDLLLGIVDDSRLAMIFVTHDLAVAAAIGDRMAVMRDGQVLEEGPALAVSRNPREAYTVALVKSALPFTRGGTAPDRLPAAPEPGDGGLRLQDVHRRFGRGARAVTALDGVDIEVRPGEIVGLIGESGSGKTTLGRIAVGLESSDRGRVTLDGAPARGFSGSLKQPAAVQMVFQHPLASFNPRRSVTASILLPLRLHSALPRRAALDRVAELLGDVGLDPAIGARRPDQLSGGQLQRAAIARALATDPRYLVCDEAVASLDVSVRAQVLDLLHRLRSTCKLGLLFISHDLGVVQ
jgi:peptide/nickel transport system ATP-binding protein